MPGKEKAVRRKKQHTHKGTASASHSGLTLAEKKCILLDSLKTVYKKQYDALQPIPYIKDRLYCIDKVFVEGGIEHFLETQSENSQKERLSSYKNIFTDSSSRSYTRRIVVGEAGYGKSTLTLQLAYDWCNGVKDSPVSAADVLILLKLRQLGNVRSIYKAIKVMLLPSEFRLNSKDIKDILQRCTTVKLILDGFDEYPNREKSNRSDIWRIIKSKLFETFDVTLTTRLIPIDFKSSSPKRLELIGFDETARDHYIRKAITGENNEHDVDKIKRGLRENPILDDICQVPLFFVTFAHMTHERDDFRKFKSVTDFFVYMLKCFHSHTRNKASDQNVVSYYVEYEINHVELDKIAFEGLNRENQQITWNKKQLRQRLGKQFYDLYIRVGILVEEEILQDSNRETSGGDIKTNTEVRFYHKIFCEWYASFRLAIVTANARNAFELEQILGKLDPFDLQYVFRFACGLSRTSASKIIEHLKKKTDCDKFAILCILEQTGDIEGIRKTVTELCSKEVIIDKDDNKLLQRSTVQLLQVASSHDIPISDLTLKWSFSKVDNNTIILQSGIALPSLSSLDKLCVNAGTVHQPEITEEDIVGLLNYVLPSRKFRKLWFVNCTLPASIRPEKIPEDLKRRNVQVLWPSNACHLDLQSGRWKKADDVRTITELCSQAVVIRRKDSVSVQRSAIELLLKASSHNIPIHWVVLGISFINIDDDGNIILSSGLSLPIITSIENMNIQTEKGREMNKHEVNGILNYVQHSQRFKVLQFSDCLLPPYTSMHGLVNLISKNVKVLWGTCGSSEGYYILNLQSGRWMQAPGRSILFPMKSIGDELTEAEYRQEVVSFRHRYRDEPWQQTWIASRGNRNLETE
ncbi:uncharacterized protein [Apostichopus japonicus]|uniref:uncharacterized protein isoform X2 n=1 Tax=Stichopus japonicus TaxID=307972 RepID=UPI003AB904CD